MQKVEKPSDWVWYPFGAGFLPLKGREIKYDKKYFAEYQKREATEQGRVITNSRVDLLDRWMENGNSIILDVGIGSGAFVKRMKELEFNIFGADVNPEGIKWLDKNKLRWNMGDCKASVLTFWDVLEHIENPFAPIERHQPEWIFLSMPIYRNENHVFQSRHYKPGEHCWYFTRSGLVDYFASNQYRCAEISLVETIRGGREDIESFAFQRV